ncbi:UNVERIFIED_CONTAM: hypothetical protein Sradi_6833800 [Sesamum radiatum]|uniref:Uncharacterized protein n=1 Tax=Sesamum radiatum TaxID=300843 RepID=A0AAW2JV39_SESRA
MTDYCWASRERDCGGGGKSGWGAWRGNDDSGLRGWCEVGGAASGMGDERAVQWGGGGRVERRGNCKEGEGCTSGRR